MKFSEQHKIIIEKYLISDFDVKEAIKKLEEFNTKEEKIKILWGWLKEDSIKSAKLNQVIKILDYIYEVK